MKIALFNALIGCLTIILSMHSCQLKESPNKETAQPSPFAHISDQKAKDLLEKAIASAGGLERWKRVKDVHFEKEFALYTESGEIENGAVQSHHYRFQPRSVVDISWQKDDEQHVLSYRENKVQKTINTKVDTTVNPQSLLNNILSATFVVSIPFNLLDPGVELSYVGPKTLPDGKTVEVLKAVYNPAKNENHSTRDIWWHYFDAESFLENSYMVQHADHFSMVQNVSMAEAGGIHFPKERKSYRVDESGNILYLRATYDYRKYEVQY